VGSPVRLVGVQVGEVKVISIFYNEAKKQMQVELNLWLRSGAQVQQDAGVYINSLGILGEKYIEIIPGKHDSRVLGENDRIAGTSPVTMESVGEMVKGILSDQEMIDDFKATLKNSRRLTEHLDTATTNLNDIMSNIKNGDGTMGKLISDDKLYGEIESIVKDLNDIMSNIKNGNGTVGKLISDDKLYGEIESIVKDLKAHPWKLLHKTDTKDTATKPGRAKGTISPRDKSRSVDSGHMVP
jgi:phospholipid/cholesterol/gamma-HCH transport system substrate-binding protein